MKFIKNVNIDTQALEFMLTNIGRKRPELPAHSYQLDIIRKWEDQGYDISKLSWESFGWEQFPFSVNLPVQGENIKWWFSKLPPGSVFPYHRDIYDETIPQKRLWVAYQDYQPGHIFSYGDKVLTDYKAGDMFEFDDTAIEHGAANIGSTPKISLQLVIV